MISIIKNPPDPVDKFSTLTSLLQTRAAHQPTQIAYTFLKDGEDDAIQWTYAELDQRARAIGAWLQQRAAVGERALLLYPPGLDYVGAFFGCLYAGVVAVPAYPPRMNRPDARLQSIAVDAEATLALTTSSIHSNLETRFEQMPELERLHWFATDGQLPNQPEDWHTPNLSHASLAFLQYTSGSTSAPRGVKVSHANLLYNLEAIQACFETTPESRGVFWLPLYHDMGLIGGVLETIYCGGTSTLLAPTDFLQRPLRWLQAISRTRATISGGPNFAYDLCVEKITPEQRASLDLSSWEVAFNGAEPIRAETLQRFAETFAECGFRREAFYPCYGLAESTLIVSGGRKAAPPVVIAVESTALEHNRVALVTDAQPHAAAYRLVGCGNSPARHELEIVDPKSQMICPTGEVGEIWVSGPSIAQGYWNRPDATSETFGSYLANNAKQPYLRTGDLGFLHQGELFITGRIKDLIIIRGRNHYPQDIEQTASESHSALAAIGGAAAFSIQVEGAEQLVIVHEMDRRARNANLEEVAQAVRQAVAQQHELQIHAVVFLKPGHLPRTSSGKVQRRACRAAFLEGTLETVGSSIVNSPDQREASTEARLILTRAALLAEAPDKRQAVLAAYLQSEVAHILKVSPTAVNQQIPVTSLGLDSLMAVELQHTIETQLGVMISMASLLEGLSIEQLTSEALEQSVSLEASSLVLPVRASQASSQYALSYGQRALWFLYQLAPESAAYNLPNAVCLRSQVNWDALQRAFQKLVDRHASLRTTFRLHDGEPVQQIAEQCDVFFQIQDAENWPQAALNTRLAEEARRPFDLEHGPLLRVHVFTRAENEHVLLLVMHHIIADLWSLAVLIQEVEQLYQAELSGENAGTMPSPNWHYTDYVGWETETLAGPEGERLWAYWKEALAGEVPALNLPTDRARPSTQTDHGACQSFQLSPVLSQNIKALGQAHGVTLYMLLLAAFEVLLYRYTGQDDFAVGTPITGRSRAEWAGLIGYFVNPLVLRAPLAGNPPFVEFIRRVREKVLAAFKHQDYPFALLIERLQPARDPSRSPLFQVMFALQKAPLLNEAGLDAFAVGDPQARLEFNGLVLDAVPLEQSIAQFDLTLTMGETPAGLSGVWEYNTDLFDAATISRLAEHFTLLLESLTANPQHRLADFSFLPTDERQKIQAWNETYVDLSHTPGLSELIEIQARQTPDAVAVIAADPTAAGTPWQRLTYRELNQRANQVAHYLKKLGVGPDVCVGLCMERSTELVVGIVGILKAGGAYVPLDPEYPQDRLQFMLNMTNTSAVVLTQERLLERAPVGAQQTVCLDRDWALISRESDELPVISNMPENLACVIYTSGSTGQPKGVLIEHRNLINLVRSFIDSYKPGIQDRILPLTSIASASFVGEVLPMLCAGGALVLPAKGDFLDFQKLIHIIAEQGISILSTVPSLMAGLNAIAESLPKLRLILSGGETLFANEVDHLLETATIVNGYGLTETTVCSTYYLLSAADLQSGTPLPVGKPVVNHQAYILDEYLNLMPVGYPGEIYLGGGGITRGYLNQPDLTAERFVPNPFASEDSLPSTVHRLYRTGDRARWLPSGVLEYLGRMDRQVKIRGFRIELEEIEAKLGRHPVVGESVVIVREDVSGDKRLAAYVVLRSPLDAAEDELRLWLAGQVPDYMLPYAFVILTALPLLPNGKVDVKALPAPSNVPSQRSTAYVAPRSETERQIAEVWQEVLNVPHVGIHDNFFDLGGHSLLLVKAHSRLNNIFPQPIALVDLFRYTTVSTLAKYVSQGPGASLNVEQFQTLAEKQKEARQQRQKRLQASGVLRKKE